MKWKKQERKREGALPSTAFEAKAQQTVDQAASRPAAGNSSPKHKGKRLESGRPYRPSRGPGRGIPVSLCACLPACFQTIGDHLFRFITLSDLCETCGSRLPPGTSVGSSCGDLCSKRRSAAERTAALTGRGMIQHIVAEPDRGHDQTHRRDGRRYRVFVLRLKVPGSNVVRVVRVSSSSSFVRHKSLMHSMSPFGPAEKNQEAQSELGSM